MHNRIDGRFTAAAKAKRRRPPSAPHADAAREVLGQNFEQLVRRSERFITAYPGVCLGAALAAGVILGWLIKRR
jgi:ElaB/YqjD/DUF883 family membrane-anchored ribosome-binding protein